MRNNNTYYKNNQSQMDRYEELAKNRVHVRYPKDGLPEVQVASYYGYLSAGGWSKGITLPTGYRVVRVNGYNNYVHRIVYMDYYKTDIKGVIKFKDEDPTNTRPENLYDCYVEPKKEVKQEVVDLFGGEDND